MRKLFLILALYLIAFAQCPIAAAVDVKAEIAEIRKIYQNINADAGNFEKIEKKLEGYSLEGGSLTAYVKTDVIYKIVANHFGEGGKRVDELYIDKDRLIFVFSVVYTYDQQHGKIVEKEENRLYFKDDTLICWIGHDKKEMNVHAEENASRGNEFVEDFRVFMSALMRNETTIFAPQRQASGEATITDELNIYSEQDVIDYLDRWLLSQNTGDFASYKAFYAEDFDGVKRVEKPIKNYDKKSWLADRKKMIESKGGINVSIKNLRIDPNPDGFYVFFDQYYYSPTYSDWGPKHVKLHFFGEDLKIIYEEILESTKLEPGFPSLYRR